MILRFLSPERWKEDSVAQDMLMRFAEDAASRATSEMKAIASQLLQDAADRDWRLLFSARFTLFVNVQFRGRHIS